MNKYYHTNLIFNNFNPRTINIRVLNTVYLILICPFSLSKTDALSIRTSPLETHALTKTRYSTTVQHFRKILKRPKTTETHPQLGALIFVNSSKINSNSQVIRSVIIFGLFTIEYRVSESP